MSFRDLPDRASLEYLKKLAKERLLALRETAADARLADAQLAVAREHGFASWRALKREIERRRGPAVAAFFSACVAGDVNALRDLLRNDASLVNERNSQGSTALHEAVRHPEAVRLLIDAGADLNARDVLDNATPLHIAAGRGHFESVRMLLAAGADVHAGGDVHKGDVIGWAARRGNEAVVHLLLEHGARHHIFSAMAIGDLDLVHRLVEENPECLSRRRSRFENHQTPLHAAVAPPDGLAGTSDYPMLALLIELGADLEARDDKGRTPLDVAMLRGDREAMRMLKAAGAKEPRKSEHRGLMNELTERARSVHKIVPMFFVPDMRATMHWYQSLGFTVEDVYEHDGEITFSRLSFGNAEFTLSPGGREPREVRLWLIADGVEELYRLIKERQLRVAHATFAGASSQEPEVRFEEDLYQPFYGGSQFSIQDNNGLTLIFWDGGTS